MLRKLIKDDLRTAFAVFCPVVVLLVLTGGVSALCLAKLSDSSDIAAVRAVVLFEMLYSVCEKLLLIAALPAVLIRARETFCSKSSLFWMSLPARSWKHIVSKSVTTVLLFLLSALMFGMVKLIYLRSYSDGIYARTAFYTISTDTAVFVRDTVMTGFVIIAAMLCVQKLVIGAAVFAMPAKSSTAAWLVGITSMFTLAGMYAAGYSAISRIGIFVISTESAQLLIYSYSCAFFGVISLVLTIADSLLISKRAEF